MNSPKNPSTSPRTNPLCAGFDFGSEGSAVTGRGYQEPEIPSRNQMAKMAKIVEMAKPVPRARGAIRDLSTHNLDKPPFRESERRKILRCALGTAYSTPQPRGGAAR